jgi:hypothetical protein
MTILLNRIIIDAIPRLIFPSRLATAALSQMRILPVLFLSLLVFMPTTSTFAAAPVAGRNTALNFDGQNDYVALGNDAKVTAASLGLPTQKITVEAWVKVDNFVDWAGIVGFFQDNLTTNYGWTLASHDNKFCFGIESKNDSIFNVDITYLQANEKYELNKWYHVAGTYDGNTMILYVDGIYVNSSTDETGDIDYADSWFRIGMYKDDDNEIAMDGQIDEVRIWNVARTQTEIQANMYTALQGNESGLVAYYDFDEAFGTTLNNKVSDNNHGTLTYIDNSDWVNGIIGNLTVTIIDKDTPLNAILSGYDADDDALTYSIVNDPSNGTVSITNSSTGAFTYTPHSNYNGTDSFTYKVNDGTTDSNIATVTIQVISTSISVSTFADLKDAILKANKHDATFTITFENDITITEHLPLIDSDIQFIGNGKTIDGGGQQQVFFVKSGIVSFSNLTIQNGLAKGGNGGYNAGWWCWYGWRYFHQ